MGELRRRKWGSKLKRGKGAGCKVGKRREGKKKIEKKEDKAAALGNEGNEVGNLDILFSRFYLLKLMSFFWFYLRIMCN